MTQPLGDPDLAAMVGLTGGERITPEQALDWLDSPSPTPSLRARIASAIADVDLVEGADEARGNLPADYDGPGVRADAVLSQVVLPLLKQKDARIAELSRDLRDTHQKLIGERRITAAYSTRFGSVPVDRPGDQPPVADQLRERIAEALSNVNCVRIEGTDRVRRPFAARSPMAFTYADAALSVVSPLLSAKDTEAARLNGKLGEALGELDAARSALEEARAGIGKWHAIVLDTARLLGISHQHNDLDRDVIFKELREQLRSGRPAAQEAPAELEDWPTTSVTGGTRIVPAEPTEVPPGFIEVLPDPALRVWHKGDPEPPAEVQVLIDREGTGLYAEMPFLVRCPGGGWVWAASAHPLTRPSPGAAWTSAVSHSRGPLTEVPEVPSGGGGAVSG